MKLTFAWIPIAIVIFILIVLAMNRPLGSLLFPCKVSTWRINTECTIMGVHNICIFYAILLYMDSFGMHRSWSCLCVFCMKLFKSLTSLLSEDYNLLTNYRALPALLFLLMAMTEICFRSCAYLWCFSGVRLHFKCFVVKMLLVLC